MFSFLFLFWPSKYSAETILIHIFDKYIEMNDDEELIFQFHGFPLSLNTFKDSFHNNKQDKMNAKRYL